MKNTKKLIYFIICVLFTSSCLIPLYYQNFDRLQSESENNAFNINSSDHIYVPFVVGVAKGPSGIDPINVWDMDSWNVISQVCEGLFKNNLSDPDLNRVNLLAESYWWENATTLQLKLREGVLFHDYTPFNSTVAKWNLDRIQYLIFNGALDAQLWRFPNGTSIMKQIDAVSEYNITIHLNAPYSPFLNLLCYPGASMISPSAYSQTEFINITTDDLIGTGPFEYDRYINGVEVDFHAFDDYWRGKANISKMVFSIYPNATARRNALLNKEIDFIGAPITPDFSMLKADPEIILAEAPNVGLEYNFLGLNNDKINVTWRKAISYAIDYTNLSQYWNTTLHESVERAYSPISPGFGDTYYNCSKIAPYYNLTIARQALINAGITNLPLDDDTGWQAAELAVFNYTYCTEFSSPIWADLYPLLADYLDKIGVTVVGEPLDLSDFIYKIIIYQQAEMYYWGWYPDFVDADYYLYKGLFSSGPENFANVNDPWLDAKIVEAGTTINENARNTIYHDIQIYLSSSLFPFVSLFHNREFFAYNAKLPNYPNNALGYLYFYPCKWTPIPVLEINSPIDNSIFANTAPTFNLTINKINYNTIWYTIDNGITNITCGMSGQISPTLWNGLDDGFCTLKFFVEDSNGSIVTDEVLIYKDTTAPKILINIPNDKDVFGSDAPSYDVSISDIHLSEMWYTLDEGLHTYIFTEFTGTIDQTAWNAIAQGEINITFYAIDVVGNLASKSITIIKSIPNGLDPIMLTIIAGLIVGGVVIASVVYIFMKRRSRA
ncbi:MAG: ABC transporter substrate-binding protein [Promethearchaeota archaeon]